MELLLNTLKSRIIQGAVLLLLLIPQDSKAQETTGSREDGRALATTLSHIQLRATLLDTGVFGREVDLFSTIYTNDSPLMSGWMRAVDTSAYPIMFGAPPAYFLTAALRDDVQLRDATAFALAWIGTAGSALVLKKVVKKPRPYVVEPGVTRKLHYASDTSLGDYSSMPSGHAALSAVIATFASLEFPKWYVVAPATVWSVSSSISRIWHGVHYPSDVLAGTILGAAAAVTVHSLK